MTKHTPAKFSPAALSKVIGAIYEGALEGRGHDIGATVGELFPREHDGLLALMLEHVTRAHKISEALKLGSLKVDALESTLDLLIPAVYFTDQQGNIVFMNNAATQQASAGNALRISKSRLVAVDSEARIALAAAIAQACDHDARPLRGIDVAIPGGEAGLCATVLPLSRRGRSNSRGAFAAVAIFVKDPTALQAPPNDAFAKLYGLTDGELRILIAMLPGLCVKKAAEMLGISEATAKTHLQHIHAKTHTSKQTELIRLLLNSTLPIKQVEEASHKAA